jgi:hypothetical protein
VKINVGCGEFPAAGWWNLDLTHPVADLHHDATTGLPPVDGPIERIYAGHVLEHLPLDVLPTVLESWRAHPGVGPDTVLAVTGPDCDIADQLMSQGLILPHTHHDIRHGGCRWAGDAHLWRSTEGATAQALHQAGWDPVPIPDWQLKDDGWPVVAVVEWQFALLATPRRTP